MPKQERSTIKGIKYANLAIVETTAKRAHATRGEVNEIIDFIGKFVHDKIVAGNMETVMLPYFGKIKPKEKLVKNGQFYKRNKLEKL